MSYGTHSVQVHHPDTGVHVVTWTLTVLGIIAAALGTWIVAATDDAVLTLFDRSWVVANIADYWAPTLLIAGGAVTALAMGTSAIRDRSHGALGAFIGIEAVLALVGVAAVVLGIVVLF